jgi:hypothetical protein
MPTIESGKSPLEWSEKDFARESEIISRHVAGVFDRIVEQVGRSLAAESAPSQASEQWIDAAYRALLAELPGEVIDTHSADLLAARIAAKKSLRTSLEQHVPFGLPDEGQVNEHAREVAQCVVSNWLALINRAVRRARREDRELVLESNWLPSGNTDADLSLGLDAFAVDPAFVVNELRSHLAAQVREEKFEINADIAVSRVGEKLVVGPATGVPALQTTVLPLLDVAAQLERLCKEMAEATHDATQTTPSAVAQLEMEADLATARVVAATASSEAARPRPAWIASERELAKEFAACVIRESSDFLEVATFSRNSPHQTKLMLEKRKAKDRERLLRDISTATKEPWTRLSTDSGKSVRRVLRIAKIATVYASAAREGLVELTVKQERYKLAQYHDNVTRTNVVADERLVRVASEVAQCAFNLPGGVTLGAQVQRQLESRATFKN